MKRSLILATAVIFALPLLTWYLWYPLAGYNIWTVRTAVTVNLLAGIGLALGLHLPLRQAGLGWDSLLQAVPLVAAAYALLLGLCLALNRFGLANLPLFRGTYRLDGFLEGWLLTGLGEELLFCGVLFRLATVRQPASHPWRAVFLLALLFSSWHLPGYLAQHRSSWELFGRLALNAVSWGFFGSLYALSGNLWLAAFAHASTDYALLPSVTEVPLLGLLFMGLLIAGAYRLRPGLHLRTEHPGDNYRYTGKGGMPG